MLHDPCRDFCCTAYTLYLGRYLFIYFTSSFILYFCVSAESVNSFKSRLDKFWSLHDFVYDYRASPLKLMRLDTRRERSDLIETFKIINNNYNIGTDLFFQFDDGGRRGHCKKLFKRSVTDFKPSFQRIIHLV